MNSIKNSGEEVVRLRRIVEACLRSVVPEDAEVPGDDADWIESGLLDSMGHVDVLVATEKAAGVADLAAPAGGKPPTPTLSAIEALRGAAAASLPIEGGHARSTGLNSHGPA